LPDDGIEEPLHEFGEMNDRKILRDLAIFLALGDNFAEKADGGCLGSPQLWRAYWIHRASENYGLPERPPHLRGVSQSFVKSPEALLRSGFGGQLGLETLGLASKGPAPDFAQYRIFAGEVAEKRRLADFQSVYNIVDARVFVAALAKKMQSRFDDLLAKPRFLAFAKPRRGFLPGGWAVAPVARSLAVVGTPMRRQGRSSRGSFCAVHEMIPPEWFAAQGARLAFR
jgi:hypothetical protein